MACNNLDSLQKKIKTAADLKLYRIQNTPTQMTKQIQDELYIGDYRVLDTFSISTKEQGSLKKALINQENYSKENLKRCPFTGKYAIEVDSSLNAIISIHPCSKIIVQLSDTSKVENLDLVQGNEIEEILNTIVADK